MADVIIGVSRRLSRNFSWRVMLSTNYTGLFNDKYYFYLPAFTRF